jgi:hypothetical protein
MHAITGVVRGSVFGGAKGAALLLASGLMLASCDGCDHKGGKLATPTFVQLQVPGNGAWRPVISNTSLFVVLPLSSGRGVHVLFTAPVGSVFTVSTRALNGTVTPLTEFTTGPQPPANAGYFQTINVDPTNSPPTYTLYVRTPDGLPDPDNYDILIVNHTQRTDDTDSDAMVVSLRKTNFTVKVTVTGPGHVISTPAGIQCGTTALGSNLTDCTHDFAFGPVTLAPNSNDPSTTHFMGWTGNCDPHQQTCAFVLDGTAGAIANATFGPSNMPASTCPQAPLLAGLVWAAIPDCASNDIAGHPGMSHPALCDANGYYCCEPVTGANAPRCGGQGQSDSTVPDCFALAPKGSFHNPGGCYVPQ